MLFSVRASEGWPAGLALEQGQLFTTDFPPFPVPRLHDMAHDVFNDATVSHGAARCNQVLLPAGPAGPAGPFSGEIVAPDQPIILPLKDPLKCNPVASKTPLTLRMR